MRIVLTLVVALAACTQNVAAIADGPPACTRALYDPCATEHDCLSNVCQTFTSPDIEVCTQPCDVNTPCPMQAGVAVTCTNAVCQPPKQNSCTIVP